MKIAANIQPADLRNDIDKLFEISAGKIMLLNKKWDPKSGSPVFTRAGKYTSVRWTDWTQGFQFGMPLLQFDSTNEAGFLGLATANVMKYMPLHLTHFGVHDHGFNIVSTFGNLLRLIREGRTGYGEWRARVCEQALMVSGAVQAARWTRLIDELGYIYSFNGRHSLFVDTIRSLRSLALAHQLGQVLMGEQDEKISLLERLLQHAETTALFNVYFGDGRDIYDVRGRVAHETVFNIDSGSFRCSATQQGYSPFSTWTRGLAWVLCGYAEELEFIDTLGEGELEAFGGKDKILKSFLSVAEAVADYYFANTPSDGIPYWDTAAPGLCRMGDYLDRPADPFNEYEPVDSSAASIAAQGFLRLGHYLSSKGNTQDGMKYTQCGLGIAHTLLSEPYLSTNPDHQGIILHSVYHRPYGWDYVPPGMKIPSGESSMWGDYHALELALLIKRMADAERYLCFFLD